ncbi:MAG: hypothetical protein M3R06_05960, partial [Chloroflexota bacterium]|nr:hypothetical protein [Chloroflexota bacterium]
MRRTAFLVLLAGASPVAAHVLGESGSPALGHARVIAQGVELMPAVPVIWRVVTINAEVASTAPVAARTLSFVYADGEPIVLTDETAKRQINFAPGEAAFTPRGVRQR